MPSVELVSAGAPAEIAVRIVTEEQDLAALGEVEVVRLDGILGQEDALEAMSDIEKRSWKGGARAGRLQSPGDLTFARAFLVGFSRRGWVRIFALRLGGRPIAFDLFLLYRNRAYGYGTAFDPEFANCSPGAILLSHSMEALFSEGVDEVNLLRGPDVYKTRWASGVRRNEDFVVWRGGALGLAAAWACVRLKWAAQGSRLARRLLGRGRAHSPGGSSPGEEPTAEDDAPL